jgi:hypothetical protein
MSRLPNPRATPKAQNPSPLCSKQHIPSNSSVSFLPHSACKNTWSISLCPIYMPYAALLLSEFHLASIHLFIIIYFPSWSNSIYLTPPKAWSWVHAFTTVIIPFSPLQILTPPPYFRLFIHPTSLAHHESRFIPYIIFIPWPSDSSQNI